MSSRHEENYPFPAEEPMPVDLQLDLLVDEELPEDKRRALLLWLDANPQRWRDLSIRFLQRQVENKSIRELLAAKTLGMAVKSPEMRQRKGASRYLAVAAGLLVAIGSAMVVVHFASPKATVTPTPGPVAVVPQPSPLVMQPEIIKTQMPGSLWNAKGTQDVTVPVTTSDTPVFFPANGSTPTAQRRTVVITSDGSQNAFIIPVTNLQYQ